MPCFCNRLTFNGKSAGFGNLFPGDHAGGIAILLEASRNDFLGLLRKMDPAALRASLRNQCFAVRAESPVPWSDRGKFGVEANCFAARFIWFGSRFVAHAAGLILA